MGSVDMEIYEALRAGGMSTEQARRVSEAMFNQHAATRQDIDRLGERLEQKIDREVERLEQKIDREVGRLEQKIDRLDQKVGCLELKFTRQLVRLEVLLSLVAAGVAAQLVQQFFR